MSTIHKIARNAASVMIGNLLFRLISLVVVIYLARYLGVEEFGKYNFVFAYLAFFGIITDLGLGDILVREMSRDAKSIPKMIGNAHVIKLILSFVAVLLSILVINIMNYPADTTKYIYIASIMLIFQSFSDNYRSVFQTTLKMEFEVTAKLIVKFLSAGIILYLIATQGTLFQIIVLLTIAELLRTIMNYLFARKLVRANFDISFELWKQLFRESLPIALSGVFLIIYHRIDVLMLSMIIKGTAGDIAIGLYSAAYKLSEPLGMIPYAIIISLFPIMSKLFKDSKEELVRSYEIGLKFILIMMLPVAVGTTLIADKIILLIYDQSYIGSATALQILIWALFIAAVNYLLVVVLTSIDKQRLSTFSMGICVIANILMNYMLIPLYSYIGASIATVATELILFVLTFYFVSNNLKTAPLHRILFKCLPACIVMGIPVYYLNNFADLNIFIIIVTAAVIYAVALFGFKTFSDDEKAIIRKVFKMGTI